MSLSDTLFELGEEITDRLQELGDSPELRLKFIALLEVLRALQRELDCAPGNAAADAFFSFMTDAALQAVGKVVKRKI